MLCLNMQNLDKIRQVFLLNFPLSVLFTFVHTDQPAHLHLSLCVLCHTSQVHEGILDIPRSLKWH